MLTPEPPFDLLRVEMDFLTYSHRHALAIVKEPQFKNDWESFCGILTSITDADVIEYFENPNQRQAKSISEAINHLINERMVKAGWRPQSHIFGDKRFRDKRWTLDFAKPGDAFGKGGFSVEVAFNHGEATAWNLIKPVLASELNHVEKETQAEIGIVVMATEGLKLAGGFDSAVGTFEKTKGYLDAMRNILSIPIILVGLEASKTFRIQHQKGTLKKIGKVVKF
jgi:hypothetical protein